MQQSKPDPSWLELLNQKISIAQKWLTLSEVHPGNVRAWFGGIRIHLQKLYGPELGAFADWPKTTEPLAKEQARPVLAARVIQLEKFVTSLSKTAHPESKNANPRRVFIGHGRSPVWRELKDFIVERVNLPYDEFNRESVAGIATSERLSQMLNEAILALLIMTAEDEHADATFHARENVIHEVGLFQGKLGMRRAIVLLEENCQTFSNIHGLTYLSFPRGRISATFEEVRRLLEREKITSEGDS